MKKCYIFLIIIGLLILVGLILGRSTANPNRQIIWGATFEKDFAQKLGLDWRAAYLAIFDDLKIKGIRLAARWTAIESQEGEYSFSDLDWQVAQAADRNVKIILAVGQKLPRWPECHQPEWVQNQESGIRNQELLKYIETAVNHYKNNAAVYAWQIENEPFLSFGECPKLNVKLLDEEIALVKRLDNRPIIITDSGELSLWVRAAKRADIFGTTMYRWVWNQQLGSYKYPIPPGFFRLKEKLVRLFVGWQKPFVVIELQGEPWTHKQIYEIPIEEQLKLMPLTELAATIEYAKQTGFSEYYWWGVEWWYYLKQNGHPEYWDKITNLIRTSK